MHQRHDESIILRNARAVLYEWLWKKFGASVSIEKKIDEIDLFRPIDCWIEQGSKIFAYWIFDSTLKSEKRNQLQESATKSKVHFNWIFASEMLHAEPENPNRIILSTTERDFLKRSSYDLITARDYSIKGSLHYLDAINHKLTTFRRLSLYHEPQVHVGLKSTSELDEVEASSQNGEFIHNGEFEILQKHQKHQENLSKLSPWERHIAERQLNSDDVEGTTDQDAKNLSSQQNPSNYYPLKNKTATCVTCGEVTDDWWWYDGKSKTCECHSCQQKRKS